MCFLPWDDYHEFPTSLFGPDKTPCSSLSDNSTPLSQHDIVNLLSPSVSLLNEKARLISSFARRGYPRQHVEIIESRSFITILHSHPLWNACDWQRLRCDFPLQIARLPLVEGRIRRQYRKRHLPFARETRI